MANIDLQGLEDRAKRVFVSQGQGGTNFTNSFVSCANDVIGRINRKADLETRISRIDAPSDTIALDEDYTDVFWDVLVVCMIQDGQRPPRGLEDQYTDMARQVGAKIDEIAYDLRNSATADDTNDETAQTAQLGPLG